MREARAPAARRARAIVARLRKGEGPPAGLTGRAPDEGWAVLARSRHHRLLDTLRGDFPRVRAAVGEMGFERLVAAYLRAQPPDDPALRNLAARFPAFVRGRVPPVVEDMARLEWAWVEVFDAADDGPPRGREALLGLRPSAWPR